jgi:hypothetical protein
MCELEHTPQLCDSSEKGLSDISKLKLKTAAYCQTSYWERQYILPLLLLIQDRFFFCLSVNFADDKRNFWTKERPLLLMQILDVLASFGGTRLMKDP